MADFGSHLDPELGVQIGKRLVHQEDRRLADDGPAHSHPLTLATRKLSGLAVQPFGQTEDVGRVTNLLVDLGLRSLGHLEGEADVLGHGHVRIEGVVLEDHGDVPLLRGLVVDDLAADLQRPGGYVLQAGHHA